VVSRETEGQSQAVLARGGRIDAHQYVTNRDSRVYLRHALIFLKKVIRAGSPNDNRSSAKRLDVLSAARGFRFKFAQLNHATLRLLDLTVTTMETIAWLMGPTLVAIAVAMLLRQHSGGGAIQRACSE